MSKLRWGINNYFTPGPNAGAPLTKGEFYSVMDLILKQVEDEAGSTGTFDVINEETAGSGVTVDGLLIKDNGIPEAAVTDHEAALTILESQITNGTILARVGSIETIAAQWDFGTTTPKMDTIAESTGGTGVTIDGVLLKDSGVVLSTNVVLRTVEVTLTATEIVGVDAGDLGHAAGAVLVAAVAGETHEFVSAVLIYDYDTAAYTAGGNDLVVRQGTTSVSAAITSADLLGDTSDDIAYINALSAADIKFTANSTINLKSTAWTQPGTAAGVLRVHITYRIHTTGL